ncbi:MAG: toll/interleukin-1 receptor domain-containing protein [Acidobacteria bacterium]|nr:toll/interleukin-1 receptor domain-containing protein [Acidobacteriota bacterium]
MNEPFQYDGFISYGAHDRGEARALAARLRRDGLRAWPGVFDGFSAEGASDKDGARPSDEARRSQREAGLEQARTLLLLLSRHATAAEWVTFEQHAVRFRDPLNQLRRLLPVRLDDAEMRDALKPFAYVDWRLRSEEQYERLLAACRPAATETARATEPKNQAQPSKVFEGHIGAVRGVAGTPDGRRIKASLASVS